MSQQILDSVKPPIPPDPARQDTLPALLSDSARRRRRPSPVALFVALLALAGVILLQLPGIATWFSQLEASREIVAMNRATVDNGTAARVQALAEARAYNADLLTGTAVVGAGERVPRADDAERTTSYDRLLAADATGLMARIKIPSIDVDLPVYHGTSDTVLEMGVGHLEGTALPVGGVDTHTVLTGHRGLAKAELFSNLDRVGVGDTFVVEVFGEVLTYRVIETQVVEPDQTQALFPVLGRDLATLVTCTPLGVNSHRILVTGERVIPTPAADLEAAGGDPTIPGFPWWAVWSGAAVIVIGGYVALNCRRPR